MTKSISQGVVHKVSKDMQKVLMSKNVILEAWENITPLARNEWIYWVEMAKKDETRKKRLKRMVEDLGNGKKRPCCWPGCPHRRKSAKKWFKNMK